MVTSSTPCSLAIFQASFSAITCTKGAAHVRSSCAEAADRRMSSGGDDAEACLRTQGGRARDIACTFVDYVQQEDLEVPEAHDYKGSSLTKSNFVIWGTGAKGIW